MPKLNGTGPEGKGAMTGRQKGNCIDEKTCVNGQRKRCCATANSTAEVNNFFQNRRGRK